MLVQQWHFGIAHSTFFQKSFGCHAVGPQAEMTNANIKQYELEETADELEL